MKELPAKLPNRQSVKRQEHLSSADAFKSPEGSAVPTSSLPSNPLIKSAKRKKKGKAKAMTLVISHLLVQPQTSASLVQKIGVYGSSHISSCLRKLKKAGLIGAIWDSQQLCLIYYNLKLEKDKPPF
jgi:hypothetical protein